MVLGCLCYCISGSYPEKEQVIKKRFLQPDKQKAIITVVLAAILYWLHPLTSGQQFILWGWPPVFGLSMLFPLQYNQLFFVVDTLILQPIYYLLLVYLIYSLVERVANAQGKKR